MTPPSTPERTTHNREVLNEHMGTPGKRVEEPDDLPPGWVKATLDELATDVTYGYTSSSTTVPVGPRMLRITDIQDDRVEWNSVPYCEISDRDKEKYLLQSGDLVFARTGATVGKSFLIRGEIPETVYASYLIRVRAAEPSITSFLSHFFKSPAYWNQITEFSAGIGQPNVNGTKLKELRLPLPPLAEQVRIADKLDALLSRVEAGRERLERVPKLIKAFRQSVLSAAVSGELTREWRERTPVDTRAVDEIVALEKARRIRHGKKFKPASEPDLAHWDTDLPESWTLASVAAVSDCLDSVRIPVKRENRGQGEYPYFGANGVVDYVDEYLFDADLVLVTEDETFFGRTKPIAYRFSGKCWVNNHAHVLQLNDAIDADYLNYCLMYYNVLPWLTGTTGRAKLTQGVLNSLPIGYPPRAEREEIVRRVEALFAIADRLEARYAQALGSFDSLTPALLAKAFRGELVPQDPNDEPASVLLERIRAQRAAGGEKPRRGRVAGGTVGKAPKPEATAETAEPKRRGRPPKIPTATSVEDAIARLEAQKQATPEVQRAEGKRQVSLFEE